MTELERFSDCSSAWFVDRAARPADDRRRGRPEAARLGRAQRAAQVLRRHPEGARRRPARRDGRSTARCRSSARCLDQAVEGVRMELTEIQRQELDQTLWRDLEAFVRVEASSELPLVPRRYEVSFGAERSHQLARPRPRRRAHALGEDRPRRRRDVRRARDRPGLQVRASPRTRRAQITQEQRLQIPLYMLVLRDLVGIEPLGGLYRPLAGERSRAGCCARARRRSCRASRGTTTSTTTSSGRARDARAARARARAADSRRRREARSARGLCPTWCDLWPVCRVKRA